MNDHDEGDNMKLGLDDKVALVLGGAGGLGRAIGSALAEEGARVALADIDPRALDDAVNEVGRGGRPVLGLRWDLRQLSDVETNIGRIEAEWGPVDVLVNNTGGPPPAAISTLDAQDWTRAFEAMFLPVVLTTNRVLPGMRQRGFGRVITSTSSGVISPIPTLGASNTIRSALVAWSKSLASEEAAHGITVNVAVPGRIATKRTEFLDEERARRDGLTVAEVRGLSEKRIPLGRYGQPGEYARAVAYLASEAASYTTGSVIRVDGGYISSI